MLLLGTMQRQEPTGDEASSSEARLQAFALVRATTPNVGAAPRAVGVQWLAAEVLLALPPGAWWTVRDRLEKHLLAAMSSDRIGAQHLPLSSMLKAFSKLAVAISPAELIDVAIVLGAWHSKKGVLVRAFVDGLVEACKALGKDSGAGAGVAQAHAKDRCVAGAGHKQTAASPCEQLPQSTWREEMRGQQADNITFSSSPQGLDRSGLSSTSRLNSTTKSVRYDDDDSAQETGSAKILLCHSDQHKSTGALPLNRKTTHDRPACIASARLLQLRAEQTRVHNTKAIAGEIDVLKPRGGDWRTRPLDMRQHSLKTGEIRQNPATANTWRQIMMPSGQLIDVETWSNPPALPDSVLNAPRDVKFRDVPVLGVGHLTNSELAVLRSLNSREKAMSEGLLSKMNSYERVTTAHVPRHKQLASALRTKSVRRDAHLTQELAVQMPRLSVAETMLLGPGMHKSGAQTARTRDLRSAIKPNQHAPTVPMLSSGEGFRPHPSWAQTGSFGWPEPSRGRAD